MDRIFQAVDTSDYFTAFEAACQSAAYNPTDQRVWKLIWKLGRLTGRISDAETIHRTLSFNEAIPRIVARTQRLLPLTAKEEDAFSLVAIVRIRSLSQANQRGLVRLSYFNSSFTHELARQVCGVTLNHLQCLVSLQLLEYANNLFHMLEPVRSVVAKMATSTMIRRIAARHANSCSTWLNDSVHGQPAKLFLSSADAIPHLNETLRWLIGERNYSAILFFLTHAQHMKLDLDVDDTINYLADQVGNSSENRVTRKHCALAVAKHAMYVGDFARSADYHQLAITFHDSEDIALNELDLMLQAAYAFHHAERPVQALDLAKRAAKLSATQGLNDYERDALLCQGELYRSRHEFTTALTVLVRACDLSAFSPAPLRLAEILYQMAVTYISLGIADLACAKIEQAMTIRLDCGDENGVADCLRTMARLKIDVNEFCIARALVEYAIVIYQRCCNPGGRIAALEIVGDIHYKTRNVLEAQQIYEECLAFWSEKGHRAWSQQIRVKIDSLPGSYRMMRVSSTANNSSES